MTTAATPQNIVDMYPLTPMQQGMLFHSLYEPESGVYVEQSDILIHGDLLVQVFARAWQDLVDRHNILRTSFSLQGVKEPVQIVHRSVAVPVEIHDWSQHSRQEQDLRAARLLEDERTRGFDVTRPPLLRVALVRRGDRLHECIWTYHHILLDGWSVPILLQELLVLYDRRKGAAAPALPEPRHFRDYIVWIKRQDPVAAESYWRNVLQGFASPTPLPIQPALQDSGRDARAEEIAMRLSEGETETIRAVARRHRITVNTLVQAAWALVLSRYADVDDVVFGATVSGRPADLPGAERMVGLFINTLPVRIRLADTTPVLSWLQEIHQQLNALRQYEYTSLMDVQRWSDIPPGIPLLESILVFENYPVESVGAAETAELSFEEVRSREETNYPLVLVAGIARELELKISFDRSRSDQQAIRRLLHHTASALRSISASTEGTVGSVSLEPQADLLRWARGPVITFDEASTGECIHEAFRRCARRRPDAVALRFEGEEMSYAELDALSDILAARLLEFGARPEDLVGVCLHRSMELMIAIMAVLKSGGAYVPLDPTYPAERLQWIMDDCRAGILLTGRSTADLLPEFRGKRVTVERDALQRTAPLRPPDGSAIEPENLAYIIYTSGSTGRPKGVMAVHSGVMNFVRSQIRDWGLTPETRVLQFSSINFDASVGEVFGPLISGGTLLLMTRETSFSAEDLHALIRQERASVITIPPSLLHFLDPEGLDCLEVVVPGGEVCPWDLAGRWMSGRRFLNAYGPTEISVACTWGCVESVESQSPSVPIGRPLPNVQVYLLDSRGRPVPTGILGEMYVGGVGVTRGYLRRPGLTAEKFLPDPFSEEAGARLYRTGDLARYLGDGRIEFVGRRDQQVKIRGFRIELGEIEARLKDHPSVKDAVVVARDDGAGPRIVAYILPAGQPAPTTEDLSAFLEALLPSYMIPALYVVLESFPLLPSGKTDRRSLPAPGTDRPVLETPYAVPRDAVETALVRIWEETLQRKPVGIHDNFFSLGGNSLLALRLLGHVQKEFRRSIPLVALFQQPTIAHQALILREVKEQETASLLVELRKGVDLEPLFLVHPTGGSVHWYSDLARHLDGRRPVIGIQSGQGQATEESIEAMAARYVHAILAHQPAGSYHIAGWSFGVIVAFEIAQQLHVLGRTVAFLAVLDQGPFVPISDDPRDLAELLNNIFRDHFPLDTEYLRQLSEEEQFRFVLRKAKKQGLFPFYIRLQDFRQYILTNKAQTGAWRRYHVHPFPGHITLIRATEGDGNHQALRDFGWGPFAGRGVEVVDVPGDHISMMQEPNVRALAAAVSRCLPAGVGGGCP